MTNPVETLAACAGNWTGTSTLQDPMNNVADESRCTATVTPVLGGRFVRMDYTWAYQGAPQEGSLLVGFVPKTGVVSAHWIDSWHNGPAVMACTGVATGTSAITVRGSYPAPEGPDWGWRIDLAPGQDELRMVMYNVTPDGEESLAVESVYARAGS